LSKINLGETAGKRKSDITQYSSK